LCGACLSLGEAYQHGIDLRRNLGIPGGNQRRHIFRHHAFDCTATAGQLLDDKRVSDFENGEQVRLKQGKQCPDFLTLLCLNTSGKNLPLDKAVTDLLI
jgi:hypothetical protein